MKPLQELTKKIHKHCPELLELSFGCRVLIEAEEYYYVNDWEKIKEDGESEFLRNFYSVECDENNVPYMKHVWDEEYAILGHPITLEHVLKVFDVIYPFVAGYSSKAGLKSDVVARWNLTKPLSEQSEETIAWLNKIIV